MIKVGSSTVRDRTKRTIEYDPDRPRSTRALANTPTRRRVSVWASLPGNKATATSATARHPRSPPASRVTSGEIRER
jgi:hypothetical protein